MDWKNDKAKTKHGLRDAVQRYEKGWYWYDETWAERFGPYDSEELARAACSNYAKSYLESDLKHLTEQEWRFARYREPEDVLHPCDNWQAWLCMCRGACSCHWRQKCVKWTSCGKKLSA